MNRVWIELDPPASNDEGHTRAEAACRMLKRCGLDFGANRLAVWWNERKQHYCFTLDGSGTFVEANDHGHWYNLDYFGRQEDHPSSCVEPTLPDEAVNRERC